ncbi:LysM peptidoglycan-binding domain-containing protein [Vagococcus bubulae]|uniref:Peptidase M23 n=1 Tax=Vagococcus bubulae TaxID=1977868 RepID=A0A429ZQC2_9ENTE|nr:LysM peptidoglycan-binding domain-containing protein [Vagococcus bubulae]RST95914.1 peptidase M23 [Vagococcus bubulae]
MKSLKTLILGSTFALGLLFSTTVLADSVYTVKSGDTLSSISVEFFGSNNNVEKIAKDNDIKNIHMIFPGQELKIITDGKTTTAPVETTTVAASEPVQETKQEVAAPSAPATTSSAKEWIAQRESGGDYNATNGYHIGRYQLDPSYLNGDYSPANQEKVADEYVAGRYGSWENAQAFWMNNGWY